MTNNILVRGVLVTGGGSSYNCWGNSISSSSIPTGHHVALIDVGAEGCSFQGIVMPSDYVAVIGAIVIKNSFAAGYSGGGCPSNISLGGVRNQFNSSPGTHIYAGGIFSTLAHANDTCVDGHGIIYDMCFDGSSGTQCFLQLQRTDRARKQHVPWQRP